MSSFAFSAANVFPLKVLLHEKVRFEANHKRRVIPVHVQLNPTNKCNFNCGFCSCSGRNRNLELSDHEIYALMLRFRRLGCESVTITGGGEPLLHKNFNEMISLIHGLGIEIGLVTNGVLLNYLPKGVLEKIVWIRVSASDVLPTQLRRLGMDTKTWLTTIGSAVTRHHLDWAFSYVVSNKVNYSLIKQIVAFANNHDFTHIRLVSDILNAEQIAYQMPLIKYRLKTKDIDDSLVNYQSRSSWTLGTNPCYISLLKPVVGADGYVYPCCGTQYALANPRRDYEKSMRLGHIDELERIYGEQEFFDGSVCVKCFYSGYNQVLHHMLNGVKHAKFV